MNRKFSLTENNKGLLCGIKLAQGEELPCQEGWCSGCQIYLDRGESQKGGDGEVDNVEWACARCPVCGLDYPHVKDGYKPPTCGRLKCIHRYLHPEPHKRIEGDKMTTHTIGNKKEPARHIQLAPTTFFLVPDCYGTKEPDVTTERCWLCSIKRQCDAKQGTVMK